MAPRGPLFFRHRGLFGRTRVLADLVGEVVEVRPFALLGFLELDAALDAGDADQAENSDKQSSEISHTLIL